ncbi:MAG: Maf family protein [Candidatus Lokiarchaeota archaeon]|nr:Maf family protein [Candidatus Lokiarchaeota archaeon]
MKKIILASKSLDRKEILERAGISFEILIIDVNEKEYIKKISDPILLVKELAKAKALEAKKLLLDFEKDLIIISADTIIEFQGQIIGKANNEEDAFKMIKSLKNQTHNLITGLAITEICSEKIIVDYETSKVCFSDLSDEEIHSYIKTGEWKGRAGSYSIRDKASLFIKYINGSSSNVIGLPMHKVFEILKNDFNLNLLK